MVKIVPEFNNWTRGELSKKMRGRNDLELYRAGLEKQQNFETDIQGSSTYRKGSEFLGETKDNNKAYLYEFIFNEAESYALEFTNTKLRFWTKGVNGKFGIVESSPGVPLEITTSYLEADLAELKVSQSADTMYIAHRNYHPKILVRTGASTFTFNDHTLTGTIPAGMNWTDADNYPDAVNIFERRLLYAGSNNNPQTIFASQSFEYDNFTQGTDDDDGYQYTIGSNKKNRIRWMSSSIDICVIGTQGGHFEMKGAGTTTGITPSNVQINRTTGNNCANLSPLNINNSILYLRSGGEKIESYQYSVDTDGNIAIDRSFLSEEITRSSIKHMTFYNGNIDYLIASLEDGRAVTLVWKPEQSVFAWSDRKTKGKYISFASLPQEIGSNRLIQSVERVIDGSTKNYIEVQAENYNLPDLEDFYTGDKEADVETYKEELYEEQKEYIHVDSSLTYNGLDIGINAGADLTITVNVAGSTDVSVTSTTPIFNINMINNQIREKGKTGWATITGFVSATEVLVTIDAVFVNTTLVAGDYYITANTISGLDHLEGEEVSICVDGGAQPRKTVESGSISLGANDEVQGSVVHVGLPYNGIMKTLNIPVDGPQGSGQAARKNLKNINVQFLETLGAKVGTNIYDLEDLEFLDIFTEGVTNNMDRPPRPFSGYKLVTVKETTQRNKNIVILKDDPTPCTVQQIIPEVNMYNN